MVEHNNVTQKQRVVFSGGGQKSFIIEAQKRLNVSLKGFAEIVGVHQRSIIDWRREKYSMSLDGLQKICSKLNIHLPEEIEIKEQFWHVSNSGRTGGMATYKKYGKVGGDSEYRKKKWREWWKNNSVVKFLPVTAPAQSPELSEFIGIILGDGGITRRQVAVTLNMHDDKDFSQHVKGLFKKLFNVEPSLFYRINNNTVNIVVSRTAIVEFLLKMGLNVGSKVRQQTRVPEWICESEVFTKSCLRGLLDTDGCFYVDRHTYKDKIYLNSGINFTNRSLPILNFFKDRLIQFGFHPTQKTPFSIFLRRKKEIIRYFNEIGSSNPKHLNKFYGYLKNVGGVR